MVVGIKKSILHLLLIGSVLGGVYAYMDHTTLAIKEAEKQVDGVKADRERLESEVKDLKEQSKIDKETTSDHNKV
jgi:cell division protein FtsB